MTPSIILVKPQMGENIGAAARAMANFGLKDLILIAPRDGWPSESANANSVGAFEHLNPVQVFDNVKEAVKPFHTIYATTARPRDMRKKVFTPEKAVEDILHKQSSSQDIAILFGGERAGLSNDDIVLANHIITYPTTPEFSSLNLGQSVLLLIAEYARQTSSIANEILPTGKSEIARAEEFNEFLDRLNHELEKKNFFRNDDMRPTITRNIRSIFSRNNLTSQEVKTLQGVLSALIGNKTK
ncbi:MAG: TrmH family RNA methyltransferase [Pseudomonadota bacterium]